MAKTRYKKDGEIKTLKQWIKKINGYDLQLTFDDLSTRQTTTFAFDEDEAKKNGKHMNFGNGLAKEVAVLGWFNMTFELYKKMNYVPSNFGLVETTEEANVEIEEVEAVEEL